jgi:hypothetical protein
MPRTAVCVDVMERTGTEWKVGTLDSAAKAPRQEVSGFVAPQFLFRMVQSQNLLPFVCAEPFAIIALPARDTAAAIGRDARRGSDPRARLPSHRHAIRSDRRGARRRIESSAARGRSTSATNCRDSVFRRIITSLTGAGGGISCAACLPVNGHEDIVIDQTVYWRLVASSGEAWYRVGLLNSDAITEAIRPFNPQGEFGERHLHTLPHRVLPVFDPSNEDHRRIASLAEPLDVGVAAIIGADPQIPDRQRR